MLPMVPALRCNAGQLYWWRTGLPLCSSHPCIVSKGLAWGQTDQCSQLTSADSHAVMHVYTVQRISPRGGSADEACMIHLKLTSFMLCTDKKQKRKKGRVANGLVSEEALAIVLFEDETEQLPVNPDLPNLDAWRPGRVLQIGDARFSIVYNPPTAEKVQPEPHLRSCPVMLLLLSYSCVIPGV